MKNAYRHRTTMRHLSSTDRRQMERMGYTVRCWYEREDNRVPFHKDFITIEEAKDFNSHLSGVRAIQITTIKTTQIERIETI